jgi:phosphorylcholine metabolism protein LicD
MVGRNDSAETLNKTLIEISRVLNENSVNDWFICYGTLLGIVRDDSCIDGDDDIDIVIHKRNHDKLTRILIENGFKIRNIGFRQGHEKYIIKTNASHFSSIDIYMADFENGNVYDIWNNLNIKDCFLDDFLETFIELKWRGTTLYLPNNYLRILKNRYGDKWYIKQDKKIKKTMKDL